jgi:hypothetical protein
LIDLSTKTMSKALKKPTASSKLSRPRKASSLKENDVFNQSDDDFVVDLAKKFEKKKTNFDRNISDKPESSTTFVLPSSDGLPNCPFCGKSFLLGQDLKR